MKTSERDALNQLLARAEQAKQIHDRIALLVAWDADQQARQVDVRSFHVYGDRREGPKWPEDNEVMSIVELGRVTRLAQLQEELIKTLGISSNEAAAIAAEEHAALMEQTHVDE